MKTNMDVTFYFDRNNTREERCLHKIKTLDYRFKDSHPNFKTVISSGVRVYTSADCNYHSLHISGESEKTLAYLNILGRRGIILPDSLSHDNPDDDFFTGCILKDIYGSGAGLKNVFLLDGGLARCKLIDYGFFGSLRKSFL